MSPHKTARTDADENGLTVGELTIAIAVLIIASLIWTTITKKEDAQKVSRMPLQYSLDTSKYHPKE